MDNRSLLTDAKRSMEESDLLRAIGNGDHAALGELYFRYYPRLAALLARCAPSRDCVEGIIIETFSVIWRSAKTGHCPAEVSTWVLGIAYTVARQMLCAAPAPTDALEQRITLSLAYQLRLSLEAIAEITRCPRSVVASRMADACEAMRRAPTTVGQRGYRIGAL
jgi:DNA-directed RNA polymerase specialized sigma24 family protein